MEYRTLGKTGLGVSARAAVDLPPLTPEERSRAMLIAGEVGTISSLGIIQG